MHIATAERSSSRQVTPHATNANDGKHRQRHRRSCAWALTTGRARRGDSRCNSSTVIHVVKPQHSKLTTSKSGSNDNGGLLYVSDVPDVPLEKSSSTKKPNDPPPPIATLRSEQSAKYELVPVQPYTSTLTVRFCLGDEEKPLSNEPGLLTSHLFVFRHKKLCPVP